MDDIFDEPIYLVPSLSLQQNPKHWYVIEDGRNINNQIKEGDHVVNPFYASDKNNDVFRSLHLPQLSRQIYSTNPVIINSCIYMLGGHDIFSDINVDYDTVLPPHDIVRFCDIDLHPPWKWQNAPSLPSPQSFMDVAASNNGLVVAIATNSSNKKCFLFLESSTTTWQLLPNPPKQLQVYLSSVRLLALTDTHILCTFRSKIEPFNYGLRFSFVNKEWEVFDKRSFNGFWSNGVVLCDSYMVLYGTDDIYDREEEIKGNLCVYDLEECRWVFMDSHAEDIYDNAFPPFCCNLFLVPTTMFKLAHNKFAFLWEDRVCDPTSLKFHNQIYCTKFILNISSATEPPSFSFEVFSHGTYRVGEPLIRSVVRVTVNGTAKKEPCLGLVQQEKKRKTGRYQSAD